MLRESLPESETHPEAKMNESSRNAWDEQRHPTSFDRSSAQRNLQTTELIPPAQFNRDVYVLNDSLPIRDNSGPYPGDG